jgi:hypothetical protein
LRGKGTCLKCLDHSSFFFHFCFLLYWGGVHCGIYKSSYIKYIIPELTPFTILLYPPILPIPGILSTGTFFPFTYICTHYFHHIHPPTPFLTSSFFLLVPIPRQDLFYHLVLQFCKRKKKNDSFAYLG